jgi:hypothetical protein
MPETKTDERPVRKVEITEGQIVRWLCYIGFFYCAISMITALTANTPWLGYLLGTIAFGTPALKMYVLYQDAERTAKERQAHQARTGGGAKRFDFGDGDGA